MASNKLLQPTVHVELVLVDKTELPIFRKMVEAYWHELMPDAIVLRDSAEGEAYFQSRFSWEGGNNNPYWALVDGRRVGFLMFRVLGDGRSAHVHDFYVVPEEHRKGYGTAMVKWLLAHLDHLGVTQIDLHVRVDNPGAGEFWKAQGFEIVQYRFRQYRDPKN
ncbi:MAG: GNAT family N-acetyltransferase [Candidatus Bipolaricaulia bacterium]